MARFFIYIFSVLICATALQANTNEQLRHGAIETRVPFIVSIQKRMPNNRYEHFCAGSIVDEEFVVTAAHCFIELSDPARISVVAGSNKLITATNSINNAQRYQVVVVDVNPYFTPLQGYDIALLKVTPKFDGERFPKIAFNVSKKVPDNNAAYLIGWGQLKPVQWLELIGYRTINARTCRQKRFNYLTSTEVCAQTITGRGACDGDSGGPLVSTDFKQLIGILSYGVKACNPRGIYVFSFLHKMQHWVKQRIVELR